jgi:nucleoside-diphosphate-sugar epimerase
VDFSPFRGRRVLITGGLGFIGSNLALRCAGLGSQVTVLTRSLSKQFNLAEAGDSVHVVQADLTTPGGDAALAGALAGQDYVFHLASQTSHILSMSDPLGDLEANCAVTLRLLEHCRRVAPRAALVMPGTVTQAGRAGGRPLNEDRPDWPLSLYEANKLACEKYLYVYHENYGLRTTTLRLANVFGERQQVTNPQRGVLNFMLKRAMSGEPLAIYEPGDFVRDYSYVANVVDALLLAALAPRAAGQAYVFGSGLGRRFDEVVERLAQAVRALCGVTVEIRRVPFPPAEKRMDVGDTVADNSRFRADTGWQERVSFDEGLERTIRFYQAHLPAYLPAPAREAQ